ncbi:MAG: hypothetical protein GX107_07515 [Clostridiales bacterium]|jgi:hypothetical protein|nr:hypothetical protein [Clostridiales bacterium]
MNQWSVLNSLRRITVLDGEGAAEALPLCLASIEEIRFMLKEGADEEDPRAVNAAAGLAYYKLTMRNISDDDSITSFKAGDVIISKSASLVMDKAAKIRDDAFVAAQPLMRDDSFIFTQA